MNIGVEVLKESVIRVQSQLNDWMISARLNQMLSEAI